jgi:hypothetical protein
MKRNPLARVAATASALVAFTLVGALASAQAASPTPMPPQMSKAQVRQAQVRMPGHRAIGKLPALSKHGAKTRSLSEVNTIVCADCGFQSPSVTMCPGNMVNGECTANGGTSMVWLTRDGATSTDNYVASDSTAGFLYSSVITSALFPPPIGVGIVGMQPRVYSRNLKRQWVAIAWGGQNKVTGTTTWSHWYQALAEHSSTTSGKLVPISVGGRCCFYAMDMTTGAAIGELNGNFSTYQKGAYRMRMAVAWYNDNGTVARQDVFTVPILTNRNAWWNWGCCDHEGFSYY